MIIAIITIIRVMSFIHLTNYLQKEEKAEREYFCVND